MGTADGCQFWLHGFPVAGRTERIAEQAEQWGFDGLLLADSQNLVGDVFVELALAARATSRLGLGTGVTNPFTRHPAVTAGAAATLQAESGGRTVLGVGRGDSSLGRLGIEQPTTRQLVDFLDRVRRYLCGGTVPAAGRLEWLSADLPVVPVELAATGPATVAAGAVHADRVMLTVGAEPERVAWGVAAARAARADAGLDPATTAVGAYVNIGCHEDPATARDLVRGSTAIFARFSSSRARAAGELPAADVAPVAQLGTSYDTVLHGLSRAPHAAGLPDDFVDRFAVVGSPRSCTERLRELLATGIDRLVLVPGSRDCDPALLHRSNAAVAADVLPALRAAGG